MKASTPVFPHIQSEDAPFESGIQMRDYAAMLFMQGMISAKSSIDEDEMADKAFALADALIRQSELASRKTTKR